jgi:peroxiredoxin
VLPPFHRCASTTQSSLTAQTEKGEPTPLSDYAGKVLLIVNTASKCGFTPQYAGLEALYKKIEGSHPGQFVVLGFPCNQFGDQEPAADDKIQEFCQVNYGVTFPIFGKTEVNGDNADPLWDHIKKEKPGLMGLKRVKWNFEKFLIGRDGKVVERWASTKKPEDLESEVLKQIEKKGPVKAEL